MTSLNIKLAINAGALVVLVSCLVMGCSSTKTEPEVTPHSTNSVNVTNAGFAGTVILTLPAGETNGAFPGGQYFPLWNPSTNIAAEALKKLPDYLENAGQEPLADPMYFEKLPLLRERLPRTLGQILGVTYEGRKAILLNCIPAEHDWNGEWRNKFAHAHDEGPRWWHIVYLPEEHKFTGLYIDLGF